MTYKSILIGLVAFLALAGVASAQSSCPECDEDGDGNTDNPYHSVDAGAILNNTTALADTDVAHSQNDDEKGLWAWLSICLSAMVGPIEDLLGVDTGLDSNTEVFASEDGVDLDATVHFGDETIDFDDSEVGDLDGMTWEAAQDVNAARDELPADVPQAEIPDYDGIDVDVCVTDVVETAGC